MFIIVYLTKKASNLRKNSTNAERVLWKHLKMKQVKGLKFRRQQPIGAHIVDFVCFQKKLIIEIDGGQHADNISDRKRDKWLIGEGFRIVRFWNQEVLINTKEVLEEIYGLC